ncbi:NifB/NifX family molybdenum-iron cluster-binding protein [Butyrivibrio proteoclasticus]|uniref:NifB/NifX family molybdenum-iron cluster-binding protein n=1 Tax=Butyrivibrio proteoclasticus TaxID=43305 RepID=UPI00047CF7D7|nr:NifB/NifX family molybdenum-iron cluster-binding protein [Butyrivibrio proteoclasticus]
MKLAVTHENGQVFQHFGHTEEFKIYEIEDGKVVSSEIMSTEGSGHEALAGLLDDKGISVLICGGLGGGANAALTEAGIEVFSGATGSADEAVEAYLKGELENSGVNCDHHGEDHNCGDHEEGGCGHCADAEAETDEAEEGCGGCGGCGDDEEGGCGGGCGGCGGCGGRSLEPIMEGKNVSKKCRVHYKGTLDDGSQFDSSYDRGEPLEFICGVGMMIYGFDKAVADMNVGEKRSIHLEPNEAYGEADPERIINIKIADLPGSESVSVGQKVYLQDMYGRPIPVRVMEKTETDITFDANHEMAGKALNFDIELVEIVEE